VSKDSGCLRLHHRASFDTRPLAAAQDEEIGDGFTDAGVIGMEDFAVLCRTMSQ
jgi:hypothetical protein